MAKDSNTFLYKWRSYPIEENLWISALIIVFIISVLSYIMFIWKDPFSFAIAFLCLVLPLRQFFFPTYYYIEDEDVRLEFLWFKYSKKWANFHCFYKDKKGLMLSTFTKPSRLDPFRGFSLRFGEGNSEEILRIVREKISKEY